MKELTTCFICKTYCIERSKKDTAKLHVRLCDKCFKCMMHILLFEGRELEKSEIIEYYNNILALEDDDRKYFIAYKDQEAKEIAEYYEFLGYPLDTSLLR